MSDLVLLDIVGGLRHVDFHPFSQTLVYDAGSMVILWDTKTDAKTNLINHESDIVCVKFSEDGKYLFTIDGGLTPSLCFWLLSGPTLIQHVYLPQKSRSRPVRNCMAMTSKTNNLLIVLENESEGYRISCWDLSKNALNFMFASELDSEALCRSMYFSNASSSVFCTSEASVIKTWKIGSTGVKQEQRIHLPQQIVDSNICSLSGAFAVLTCMGSIVILSSDGKYISSLAAKGKKYTAVVIRRDTLYVGCENGAVELYNVSSLSYLGTIPYCSEIHESSLVQVEKSQTGAAKMTIGPKVTRILVDGYLDKGEYISVVYIDGSVGVYNVFKNSLTTYLIGHFNKVSAAKWLSSKLASSFVTCSYDMALYLWSHSGDRWSFTYFDIPMLIDPALRHYRFAVESTTSIPRPTSPTSKDSSEFASIKGVGKKLQLTAVAIHPKHPYVACGSNQGSIWFLDISKSTLISHAKPSILKIVEMSFSPSGNFLAVAYSSGLINLYDVRANFEFLLQLEEPVKANSKPDKLSKLYYIGVILSHDPASGPILSTEPGALNVSRSGIFGTNAPMYSKLNQISEPAFYALATHNFSIVRVHKIYIKAGKLIKDYLVDLPLDEGKVSGFDIHPSREYALLLSDAGYLYVYHIHLAQLRGKLRILPGAWGCKVDPSGLYTAIAVPIDGDTDTDIKSNYMSCSGSATEYDFYNIPKIEAGDRKKRRRVQVIEVGTGEIAAEINNICNVSSFDFSKNGRYLTLGSTKGTITVWAVGGTMRENIAQVLDSMALNPEFWNNYPLYLPIEATEVEHKECLGGYPAVSQKESTAPIPKTVREKKVTETLSLPHASYPTLPLPRLNQRYAPDKPPLENLAQRGYVHPPQQFKPIDHFKVPQPRIQTQFAPTFSEVVTSSAEGAKKFQRGCTFYGVAKSLYGKRGETPALQREPKLSVRGENVLTPPLPSHNQRERKSQLEMAKDNVKILYTSQEDAIAALLDKPLSEPEVPAKRIQPDPEDIDKDEDAEEIINEVQNKRRTSITASNVESASACDVVDKMYEEINTFNEKHCRNMVQPQDNFYL